MSGPTVLGINFVYHQPSACLVQNGLLVGAIEEERLSRIKGGKTAHIDNTLVLPFRSIDAVLASANLSLRDIDLIATNFCPDRRKIFLTEWAKYDPVLEGNYETPTGDAGFRRLIELAPQVLAARFNVSANWVGDRFRWVPHHIAHIASAFYPSGFESAAAMTIDGIGEFETAVLADCDGASIAVLEETRYPNSLGFIWEVITNFLGFESNNDESETVDLLLTAIRPCFVPRSDNCSRSSRRDVFELSSIPPFSAIISRLSRRPSASSAACPTSRSRGRGETAGTPTLPRHCKRPRTECSSNKRAPCGNAPGGTASSWPAACV